MLSRCHLTTQRIIFRMDYHLWLPFQNEWLTFLVILISILIFVMTSELLLKYEMLSPESNRRLVHICIGSLITLSPIVFNNYELPATLALIFIILNYFAYHNKSFKGIHSQNRITYGTIYFPIGYLIISICFWQHTELVIISLSLLTISDPLASYIGEKTSKNIEFVIWEDKKTVKGTIAFFISSTLIIFLITKFLFNFSISYLLFFTLFTAISATIAEITSSRGSDNLSIPIITILFMLGFLEGIPSISLNIMDILLSEKLLLIYLITFLFFVAYRLRTLSLDGLFGAGIMGTLIILFGSKYHLFSIATFFILSSLLSKVLKNASFYRSKGSRRDILQVYANGGIALLICIVGHFNNDPILIYLFFSSVAAAMSDTWGTELGKLSKQRPISIVSLKSVNHGMSGGITRIGTLGSLLGSCIIGLTAWLSMPIQSHIIYGIIFSGLLASLFDSVLGATVQGKYKDQNGEITEKENENNSLFQGYSLINNDTVNLLNTTISPIIMYIYLFLF